MLIFSSYFFLLPIKAAGTRCNALLSENSVITRFFYVRFTGSFSTGFISYFYITGKCSYFSIFLVLFAPPGRQSYDCCTGGTFGCQDCILFQLGLQRCIQSEINRMIDVFTVNDFFQPSSSVF